MFVIGLVVGTAAGAIAGAIAVLLAMDRQWAARELDLDARDRARMPARR